MAIRAVLVLIAVVLAGCASSQAYSDATNAWERKAYITCAVTRALLVDDYDAAPQEAVRKAMQQCNDERLALFAKLIAENAGKPFAMTFVEAYMDELQATMLEHISLRLEQRNSRTPHNTKI